MTTEQEFLGNEPKCPTPNLHGYPFRYCPNCNWIEPAPKDAPGPTAKGAEAYLTDTDKAYLRNADGEVIATLQPDGQYYSAEQLEKATIPLIKFPEPKPSLGRVVHYKLRESDAQAINARREDAEIARPGDKRTGVIVHRGNRAHAGDVYAATIVRVWNEHLVNLQVQCDGNDIYWACSVAHGEDEGEYTWPPRV